METNIQKYLAFISAVEYNSFTKAAEKSGYTQSAISKMIADLEKEWNITLLERNKHGVQLTSDGKSLLPYIKNLCAEFEKLQNHVKDLQGFESGLIRIGTFSSVATHWLPEIIKQFQKDYPGIDYELLLGDYSEIETWIMDGRVDCGFLSLPAAPDFDTVSLHKDELMAIIPKGHVYENAERFPLAALEKEPFMLLERGAKAEISAIFEKHNLHPRIHFTTWDDYAIMSMVEQGLGIAILPNLILKKIPYNIIAKPLEIPAYRDIGFALKNKETASLAVKKFMKYLSYRDLNTNI